MRSVMVARMRCKDCEGREQGQPLACGGRLPPPPFYPLSPVSDGWSLGSALYTWLRAAYRRVQSAEWSRGVGALLVVVQAVIFNGGGTRD